MAYEPYGILYGKDGSVAKPRYKIDYEEHLKFGFYFKTKEEAEAAAAADKEAEAPAKPAAKRTAKPKDAE